MDRLLTENYLLILKSTVEVYVHGTLESSNNDVREVLKTNLNDIMTSQADTYNRMMEKGWYQVQNAEVSEISKTINKIQSSN